ncbi:MAG: M1 family metallopeptidase [Anaerolineae bacterium]
MSIMLISRTTTFVLLHIVLTACALSPSFGVKSSPSSSATILQATLVPTLARDLHPIELITPTLSPNTTNCENTDNSRNTNYQVLTNLDYATRTLGVTETISYTNHNNETLTDIVINIKPNNVKLESVKIGEDKSKPEFHLAQNRLNIKLIEPLQNGCTLVIHLDFRIILQPITERGSDAFEGYLGYSDRQLNLGQWLPVLAVRSRNEWISRQDSHIGEFDVLEIADWDITLKIQKAPDTVQVAAPGRVEKLSPTEWHFSLMSARDFSLSIGENYRIHESSSTSGVKIEVYSYDDALISSANGPIDTAAFALDTATKSLEMYEDLYGNYPYERLVVVQGDFPDGMEFSGLVFVGGDYFRNFSGPDSYLMIITAHEVSHQWWYAQVGNDQALDPWLDEALATYNEYIFIEEYYPELKDWWWNFRVNRLSPDGFVDSTIYDFSKRRAYINAVYLRGALMFQELRSVLGTDDFFAWLRRYVETNKNLIIDHDTIWNSLTPEQFVATADVRQKYLRGQQIIR